MVCGRRVGSHSCIHKRLANTGRTGKLSRHFLKSTFMAPQDGHFRFFTLVAPEGIRIELCGDP